MDQEASDSTSTSIPLSLEPIKEQKPAFSWEVEGKNYAITFSNGHIVHTNDYQPILNSIPAQAVEFSFDKEQNAYFYRRAKINFTKIDRGSKLQITRNMHMEFKSDVDSIIYGYYQLEFPTDTTVPMPARPKIYERLELSARCWDDCHPGERGMEVIIGSKSNSAWFDHKGNLINEFAGDRFDVSQLSSDTKFAGGAIGGHYSDGGGFYRKSRLYVYEVLSGKMVFHKELEMGLDFNFRYQKDMDKWVLNVYHKEGDENYYIDIATKKAYIIDRSKFEDKQWLSSDESGYHFTDNTALLFERDFDTLPLDSLNDPYSAP